MSAAEGVAGPPNFDVATPHKPLSRARIERMFGRVVAVFGVVFAVQIVPGLLEAVHLMVEPWTLLGAAALLGCMIWVVVAAVIQRALVASMTAAALIYLASLLTWPLLVSDPSSVPATPWLWYLCTVATAYAAIAMPVPVAAVYTVLTPVVYGALRVTPAGGHASLTDAVLDVAYAIILGGALLLIVTMVRAAASGVDAAQAAALDRYTAAAREHASEAERVEVDAIVHDSVLTTLLAAAGARSDEAMAVAARMAKEAIGHLDAAAVDPPAEESSCGFDRLAERMSTAARSFSVPFEVSRMGATAVPIPMTVADALHAAAVQSMVNSVQHAGRTGVHRSIVISAPQPDTIAVSITDDGAGFDPAAVGRERLGLRVSILERVSRVGGRVSVRSAIGEGTTITLGWTARRGGQDA